MKSKIRAFVEYKFDYLMRKNILNSYILVIVFNIILFALSKGVGDQILFGSILFLFIIISNRILNSVKKFMMRTFLFKGLVSIYLNLLFTVTFYYVISLGKQHDFKVLFFLLLITVFFNLVSFILAKYNIKKGKYTNRKEIVRYKLNKKKALLLVLTIVIARVLVMQYIKFSVLEYSFLILYFIVILCAFYFMFIFNSVNLQLLKAYYIKKFNLEKDESRYVDLADRLRKC